MRTLLSQLFLPGLAALLCLLPGGPRQPAEHACRFWAFIGIDCPAGLITDHLRDGTISNLRALGGSNVDGWGFACFLQTSTMPALNLPLIRRGGPPANHPHDPDYDLAVDELVALSPRAALGHVRAGSSGHWGIPDPHPFQHEGIVFCHNGSVHEPALLELLTADDPNYLKSHPPDYASGYIDSELYFLYLLKYIRLHPEFSRVEALRKAIREVASMMDGRRLNFVATAGDTLFALRHCPGDSGDPVRYYPTLTGNDASRFWVVASEIVGSTAEGWGSIPANTLAVFIPGRPPEFLSIEPEIHPPDASTVEIGPVQPNPVMDRLAIPIDVVAEEGGEVTLEVYDSQGRLVWSEGPTWYGAGKEWLRWDGRSRSGIMVASGSYFCRVTIGNQCREQTISIVR